MEKLFVLLTLTSVMTVALGTENMQGCDPEQILEFGSKGIVQCNFGQDYFGIFWYNSTDVFNERSIIDLKRSMKSGRGFTSGEFDIFQNGSLLIYNVSLMHDCMFAVLKFATPQDQPNPHFVRVNVIVKPQQPSPFVDDCSNAEGLCFLQIYNDSLINCSVRNSKPAMNLTWYRITHTGASVIPSQFGVLQKGWLFTSYSTVKIDIANKFTAPLLELGLCKAFSPTLPLLRTETNVLIESKYTLHTKSPRPFKKILTRNSTLRLACIERKVDFLVWKKVLNNIQTVLAIALHVDRNATKTFDNDVQVEGSGYLIIPHISIQNEGIYYCLFSAEDYTAVTSYDVNVYVAPTPSYPLVEGCHQQENCSLPLQEKGSLKCTLRGIRPQVQLYWKVLDKRSAPLITFLHHRETVIKAGDTFDISISTEYRISTFTTENIAIECTVHKKDSVPLQLTTRIELKLLHAGSIAHPSEASAKSFNTFFWIPLVAFTTILATVFGVTILTVKRRKKSSTRTTQRVLLRQETPGKKIIAMQSCHRKSILTGNIG